MCNNCGYTETNIVEELVLVFCAIAFSCNQDNGGQTYTLSVDYIWNFEKFDFPLYKMCFSFTCNYTGVNKSYCFLSVYIDNR